MPFMHCCSLYSPTDAGKGAGNRWRGVAFVASIVATSPQLTWWYVTTGHTINYGYPAKVSNFTSPELRQLPVFDPQGRVLSGTPLYLLMIGALLAKAFRVARSTAAVSILITLMRFISAASWGDYTFGMSFGSRQSIELCQS